MEPNESELGTEARAMLAFVDGLRDRGVQQVRVKFRSGAELELVIAPRAANELPVTNEERTKLMNDPTTPAEVKERIAEEDERDLFASA